jgi:hypothetical protein
MWGMHDPLVPSVARVRADLNMAWRALRLAWTAPSARLQGARPHWPGLAQVARGALIWLEAPLPDRRAQEAKTALLALAHEVERIGQDMASRGLEPAYHHRLHMADTLVALAAILKVQRMRQGRQGHALSAAEWCLLMAMTAHDAGHDGRMNQAPAEMEQHTVQWLLPWVRAQGWPPARVRHWQALILGTDPVCTAQHRAAYGRHDPAWHERRPGAPSRALQHLWLREADLLASASPAHGPALTLALHQEWQGRYPKAAAGLLGRAARARFLREQGRWDSPAARALMGQGPVDTN